MDADEHDVRAARAGDQAAFGRLCERFHRPLYVHVAAIVGSRDAAEDALQNALLHAWRALPSLRREDLFAPWLFRIAGNAARDERRRRRRGPALLADGDDLAASAPGDRPEIEEVRRAVAALKPKSRSILLLRCVSELSAEEIGRALSVSPSTVRRRLSRILDHLRSVLAKGGVDV